MIFRKARERKQQEGKLVDKIFRFLNRAEEFVSVAPDIGSKFLLRANSLYKELGYNFQVDCRINEVCFAYMPYVAKKHGFKYE